MSHGTHTSTRWYDSEDDVPDDHDTFSATTSHRRTSESTEPSSRSGRLSAPTFVPSTSQNIRNDRLQAQIKQLASSNERDGGGKSLGAATKWIKRSRAGNGEAPPTFKGGVVGQPVEIEPRGSLQHNYKKQRLTAPPRRIEELIESAPPQSPQLGRQPSMNRPCGSKTATLDSSYTFDSESPYLPNLGHDRTSSTPDWLMSILSEADNLPAPPLAPHQHYLPAPPTATPNFSTNENQSSHAYQPMKLPPTPYSLPADLHNSVRLGGPPTPSRPLFEAQLARVSPTRTDFSQPHDPRIYPNQIQWFPYKHSAAMSRPEDDQRPCTPPPIPCAQSISSSPSFENSQPYHHHSPLEDLNKPNQDLGIHSWEQESVVAPYEPILHSSSSDRRTPSLFAESSDSEVGNDFWTRGNLHTSSLIRPQPIDPNATSNDRYAASLARMAREQIRANSTLNTRDPRPLTFTPVPSLIAEHRPEMVALKWSERDVTGVDQSERLCTPPPPSLPPPTLHPQHPQTKTALHTTEEKALEGPPPAEIFLRASSAPPMLVLDGEALNGTQGTEMKEVGVQEGVQDEEMGDGAEDPIQAGKETRSTTASDSMVTAGFATTTITENLTVGASEPDEDDLLLQRMIEDAEINLEDQIAGGEESWSFWEDTDSEMYDD